MPYDGPFKNTRPVTPTRPNRPTQREVWERQRQNVTERRTRRPPVPRAPPSPDFSIPDMPKNPRVGTAVPTTPAPTYAGMPRGRQYLRWFMPAGFDSWGYALSFRYLFEPVIQRPGGIKIPRGYEYCGQLKGDMIGTGPLNRPPKTPPYLCQVVPLGGQIKPLAGNAPHDQYVFHETTTFIGGKPYGTTYGLLWRPNNVQRQDVTVSQGVTVNQPVQVVQPWRGVPQPVAGSRPMPVPWVVQPHRPVAPSVQMGPTRSYGYSPPQGPGGDDGGPPGPGSSPEDPTNPHKPPPPRTKERKGKIPKWFGGLAKAAWEATETVDLVENLFDCLPKPVQKKAPKTGVTMPDAWKPGVKYTSAVDKAKHVYSNINQLDLDCAMRKVSCNHIEDMLWGRFFGGVDAAAFRAGLKGFGNAAGSLDGLRLTKEAKAAFERWIKDNPPLDSLRKSLDCENLGRS